MIGRRKGLRFVWVAGLAVGVLLLSPAQATGQECGLIGKIFEGIEPLRGEALKLRILRAGSWLSAKSGMPVLAGDQLRGVPGLKKFEIIFRNGDVAEYFPGKGTDVVNVEILSCKDENLIRHIRGKLIAFARKLRPQTDVAVVAPRGSIFSVESLTGTTVVRVFRGVVEVENKFGKTEVGELEEAVVEAGTAPQKRKIGGRDLQVSRLQLLDVYRTVRRDDRELGELVARLGRDVKDYRLEIALAFPESIENLPFYVAAHSGLFADEGLDIEVRFFGSMSAVIAAVDSGKILVGGASGMLDVLRTRGLRSVRIVSVNTVYPGIGLVCTSDSPIRSLSDLKGMRVAVSRPESVSDFLYRWGRKEGLPEPEYIAGLTAYAALRAKKIDAAWIGEPLLSQGIKEGTLRLVGYPKEFTPAFVDTVNVVNTEYGEQNREVIFAVLKAHRRAIEQVRKKGSEVVDAYVKFSGVPREVAENVVKNLPEEQFGWNIHRETVELVVKQAGQLGILKDANLGIFDDSYLPR